MFYDLPTTVEIGGAEYPIRSDFRTALDMIQVMGDPELDDEQRTLLLFEFFFDAWDEELEDGTVIEHDWHDVPAEHWQEAIERVFWFVGGGKEGPRRKMPKLMDWEQDFQMIAAPVNRVLGFECRHAEYLHWWSFLAAYYEVGDCLFAQVVSVRKKRAQGRKLDKADQAFARENADLVNFKVTTTASEDAVLQEWIT